MKCPDCKIQMVIQPFMLDKRMIPILVDEKIWKCPKCKMELEEEE